GDARRDRVELPAVLRRGVRLEVEGLHVAGAAPQPEDDHRFRRSGYSPVRRFEAEQVGEAERPQPREAGAQERTSVEGARAVRGEWLGHRFFFLGAGAGALADSPTVNHRCGTLTPKSASAARASRVTSFTRHTTRSGPAPAAFSSAVRR